MDIQTEKIALAKLVLETSDEFLLIQIKDVFENHEKDFWDDLPEHVKAGIKRGQEQSRNGKVTPHEEVMKNTKSIL